MHPASRQKIAACRAGRVAAGPLDPPVIDSRLAEPGHSAADSFDARALRGRRPLYGLESASAPSFCTGIMSSRDRPVARSSVLATKIEE